MPVDRMAMVIGKCFKMPPPPSIEVRINGAPPIHFSHFKSVEPKPGLSTAADRQEAFVINVPLIPAKYSIVSIDGRVQSVMQTPGEAHLYDLTRRNEVSLDAIHDSIRIHLPQTAIDQLAYEKGLPRVGGLHARRLEQKDEILYHLALTVHPVLLKRRKVTIAFMEHLTLALHDHVIHTYGGVARGGRPTGGLAQWQIRRACDFIEANLAGDPSLAALSHECGISPSYFTRAFRVSIGMTPHHWITRRRIERAKSLIVHSKASLAEISFMCGFADQSHLGRHFLREEGVSPAQWRRQHYRPRVFDEESVDHV